VTCQKNTRTRTPGKRKRGVGKKLAERERSENEKGLEFRRRKNYGMKKGKKKETISGD